MDYAGLSTSTHASANLVLHCATPQQRPALNAQQPLSPMLQRFPRESSTHTM